MKTYIPKSLIASLLMSTFASFAFEDFNKFNRIIRDNEYTNMPEHILDMTHVQYVDDIPEKDESQAKKPWLTPEHKDTLEDMAGSCATMGVGGCFQKMGPHYSFPMNVAFTMFANYFKIGSVDMSKKKKAAICATCLGAGAGFDYFIGLPYLGIPLGVTVGTAGASAILKKGHKQKLKQKKFKNKKFKQFDDELEIVIINQPQQINNNNNQ